MFKLPDDVLSIVVFFLTNNDVHRLLQSNSQIVYWYPCLTQFIQRRKLCSPLTFVNAWPKLDINSITCILHIYGESTYFRMKKGEHNAFLEYTKFSFFEKLHIFDNCVQLQCGNVFVTHHNVRFLANDKPILIFGRENYLREFRPEFKNW
jgi:hypothetical protein